MLAGLFVGFVLSWSGILLDWVDDVEEGSYVIFTMPLCALIGLGLFAVGRICHVSTQSDKEKEGGIVNAKSSQIVRMS